jgi:hypothetical protein
MTETLERMVDRAALLHEEIGQRERELKGLKEMLAAGASFKPGSGTGHAFGARYEAKVQLRENVKWDQDALNGLRTEMGDNAFLGLFKWSFEPVSAKIVGGYLQFGAFKEKVAAARTATPGSPQVSFRLMEEV